MTDIKTIPEGWIETTLKELTVPNVEKISVSDLNILNYISTENMEADIGGVKGATNLPKITSASKYFPGDVLFSNIRTYFKKLWLSDRIGGSSNDVLIFRGNEKIVDKKFLFYVLSQDVFFDYTVKTSKGTKMPRGDKDSINKFPILLPPLPEQQVIARMLSSFDDKIELLREQNETLEKTAQMIFQEWFGKYGVEDELPEGWREGRLGDEFDILMGQSPNGDTYNDAGEGVVFFQGRTDFTERFPTIRQYTTEPKRMANIYDVLVSVRAPVGDINVATESCCIGRGLAAVSSEYKSYCLYKIKSLKESFNKFESEGTIFGSINKDAFLNIKIIISSKDEIIQFEGIVNPIDQKIFHNYQEIKTLSKARDELLPRLMSGEVRV